MRFLFGVITKSDIFLLSRFFGRWHWRCSIRSKCDVGVTLRHTPSYLTQFDDTFCAANRIGGLS